MNWFIKALRDIAITVIGSFIFTGIYTYVRGLVKGISFEDSLNLLVNTRISILWFAGTIILIFIGYLVYASWQRHHGEVYTEDHRRLDQELFTRIRGELIPGNESIAFIRNHDFHGSFRSDHLNQLDDFREECEHNPTLRFLDPELEEIKKRLKDSIENFGHEVGLNTFALDANVHFNQVPKEWEINQPDRHRQVIETIHHAAENVCSNYDELMEKGRLKLGV